MEKIYFNENLNRWYVKDLSDFYTIVYKNAIDTKQGILGWTKDSESEEKIKTDKSIADVRLYLLEIEDRKFHFILQYDLGNFFISPINEYEFEFFRNETGYEFVGEIEVKTE